MRINFTFIILLAFFKAEFAAGEFKKAQSLDQCVHILAGLKHPIRHLKEHKVFACYSKQDPQLGEVYRITLTNFGSEAEVCLLTVQRAPSRYHFSILKQTNGELDCDKLVSEVNDKELIDGL